MIYYGNKKKEELKNYIINLKENNKKYSISLYVSKNKIKISLSYKNNNNNIDEIYENFYYFYQLQIINKYFRTFNNLKQICLELDKLLKSNKVAIEEKKDYIILSMPVSFNNEPTNIVFKLLKNKISNSIIQNNMIGSSITSVKNNTNYHCKTTLSMPKYNKNDSKLLLTLKYNDDINDSFEIESNPRPKYMSASKINKNNIISIKKKFNKNDSKLNLNNLLKKVNKLEKSNIEKENVIKELKDILNKYEDKNNQKHSINNRSKNDSNKNTQSNMDELDINSGNKKKRSINVSSENKEEKLKSKKHSDGHKNKKYYFYPISKEENDKNYKNANLKEDIKDANNKKNLKNSKSEINLKIKKGSYIKNEEENNIKNNDSRRSSSVFIKINKKNGEEVSKRNEEDKNVENSKTKTEIFLERNIQIKKENEDINNKTISDDLKEEDLKDLMKKTGLRMIKREDLKEYINSRIFYTKKELQMVKNKITKGNITLHAYFDVLYRASIDGDYEDNINYLCEGIYPQVILFYTQEGARFGVYIEKIRQIDIFGNIKYKEVPGTSFLISLNSLKTYNILKGAKASDDRPEKLCFGRTFYYNNNESNWFIYTPRNEFINVKCMIGDKLSTFGEINTKEIIGNKKEYYLKDVEIFKVVVYEN